MNKTLTVLSFLMGLVVLSSNYLVQFPVNYYGLNEILTYGAFSYPVAFLITDLSNRSFGKIIARRLPQESLENQKILSWEILKVSLITSFIIITFLYTFHKILYSQGFLPESTLHDHIIIILVGIYLSNIFLNIYFN